MEHDTTYPTANCDKPIPDDPEMATVCILRSFVVEEGADGKRFWSAMAEKCGGIQSVRCEPVASVS